MKRILRFSTLIFVIFLLITVSCAKKTRLLQTDKGMMIKDYTFFHNAGITFDGEHYITTSGGNSYYSRINMYNLSGNLVKSIDAGIDGRSIHYLMNQKRLLVKKYGNYLMDIDEANESGENNYDIYFIESNSSIAFDPNEDYVYEMTNYGDIIVTDIISGDLVNEITIAKYYDEILYNTSIAVGQKYLYIWGGKDKIYMYDKKGTLNDSIDIQFNAYPLSLSYCNGMLWIAQDADAESNGGYGYYYGFDVE